MSALGPGCVKTVGAVVRAQQKNQTCGLSESLVRERHSVRINLAPERPTEWFSHSLGHQRTKDTTGLEVSSKG